MYSEQQIHSPIDIPSMVSEIQSVRLPSGIELDRVIGYGSYWWGDYLPESSDVDIAVLFCRTDGGALSKDHLVGLKHSFDSPYLVIDLLEIETYRHLSTMMYGKILTRGAVLFSNETTSTLRDKTANSALPYCSARDQWIQKCRTNGRAILADVFSDEKILRKNPSRLHTLAASAQTAVVIILWSILYEYDIDPSNKSLRWDIEKLMTIAAVFRPDLKVLIQYTKGLPTDTIKNCAQYCDNRETLRLLNIAHSLHAKIECTG
jgi:hypothetical protein